jgi:hypothetical protein
MRQKKLFFWRENVSAKNADFEKTNLQKLDQNLKHILCEKEAHASLEISIYAHG